ncbi:YbbR-like domain-containing protein [Halobacillus sp. Marseille-P3879]|uniref:CdaR family protein n=1 Tax=Halobacillus sp. Marseille-P3879 TaxID=2045014 RepID=UPI000C7C906E|nr:CdaR family protein [Halobacillus sp. Marseille-P3879]
MDNLFRNKWFIRIISLLLAVLLWVSINVDDNMDSDSQWFNDTSSVTEVMNDIPLEVQFDSEEYVVSGLPQNVTVSVEGPNSAVAPVVRQQNFTAFVDLNDLGPGTHEVNVQHSGISNQLSVDIEPQVVEVTIEEKESQDFPVNIDYINESEIENDFTIGDAAIEPEEVTITGSSEAIDRVASVKAIIDVGEAEGTLEDIEAPVKVYDSQGNELNVLLDPTTVDVTVPITKSEKDVSVSFEPEGDTPEGVEVDSITSETDSVTITGPNDVLAEIDNFDDIPVDVSDISESGTVEVDIPLPDDVSAVEPETVEVEVEVEEVTDEQQ